MLSKQIYRDGTSLLMAKFPEGKVETKFDYDYLNDIKDIDFSNGIKRIIQEYEYKNYPSIATIRKYCGYDLETISKQAINKTLFKAVRKVRDTVTLCFSDKALNAVANRYGGHRVMQFWSEQDWLYNQKAMIDLYDGFVRSGVGEDKVMGSFESNIDYKQSYETCIVWNDGGAVKGQNILFNKNGELEYKDDKKWLSVIGINNNSNQYKQIEDITKQTFKEV